MPARKPTTTRRSAVRTVAPPSFGERLAGRAGTAGRSLAALLSRDPATTLGTTGFVLFAAVVAANALTAQPGRHPQPLFATRVPDDGGGAGAHLADPLVRTIQEGLRATGHYAGGVDGRAGPATEEAIRRFQGEWGLVPTGQPTPALAVAVTNAAAVARTGSVGGLEPVREASLNARFGEAPETANDAAGTGAMPEEADPSPLADLPPEEVVRRIQAGLSDARVAELKPDGIAGPATRRAIEAFQALDGMEVTGRADAALLQRLIDLGLAQ